jgi:hypothetical protein
MERPDWVDPGLPLASIGRGPTFDLQASQDIKNFRILHQLSSLGSPPGRRIDDGQLSLMIQIRSKKKKL